MKHLLLLLVVGGDGVLYVFPSNTIHHAVVCTCSLIEACRLGAKECVEVLITADSNIESIYDTEGTVDNPRWSSPYVFRFRVSI